MRLLADENCDFSVVRALRAGGHDVLAVAEIAPRAVDTEIIERCHRDGRILITEDKDFGQLVYASGTSASGIILLRFPARRRAEIVASILALLAHHGDRLIGSYVVLQPGRARVTRLPQRR